MALTTYGYCRYGLNEIQHVKFLIQCFTVIDYSVTVNNNNNNNMI